MPLSFSNKRSLQDTLVLFGSAFTFLFVFSMSLYRFNEGDRFLGIVDLFLSAGFVGIFLTAWFSKKIKYLNLMIICFYTSAVIALIYFNSTEMIFWVYPAIFSTYFFIGSTSAAFINSIFIGIVLSISISKDPSGINFYPTLILSFIFGFIFSFRSEAQTKRLSKFVSEDELTQVKNRLAFDEKIDEMLALNKRLLVPMSLLLVDLDLTTPNKKTSDQKQLELDKVLYHFAQKMKSIIRTTDYLYRFDKNKFVIIATNSNLEDTGVLARNILESTNETLLDSKSKVSIFSGITQIVENDDPNTSFHRANLALYESRMFGDKSIYLALQNKHGELEFVLAKQKNNEIFNKSSQKISNRVVKTQLQSELINEQAIV